MKRYKHVVRRLGPMSNKKFCEALDMIEHQGHIIIDITPLADYNGSKGRVDWTGEWSVVIKEKQLD